MSQTGKSEDCPRVSQRAPQISHHRAVNFIHGHRSELLAAGYLLYVLLGTLIPFDFTLSEGLGAGRTPLGLGNARSGIPDVMSNIALYIPLGVLVHAALLKRLGRLGAAICWTVIVATAISYGVERLQVLSPTRVSSVTDFAANAFGATSGAVLSCLCRGPVLELLASFGRGFCHEPSVTLVKAFAGLLLVGALVPFTPTIDVTRLGRAVRSSTWTLFAQTEALAKQARDAERAGRLDDAAAFQDERMGLWARWTAELLSFAILGWMLHDVLRAHYGFKPAASLALTIYLAAALAVVMSALQLLIMSRGLHLTDVAARVAGVVCGGVAHAGRLAKGGPADASLVRLWPRLAWPALVVVLAFVLFSSLTPFQVDLSLPAAAAKGTAGNVLPIYSYFQGRFDRVCADFWGKALRFGFLGVAMWMCWQVRRGASLRDRMFAIAVTALVLSAVLECCQLFIRSRVPAATDVIIAVLAAWAGATAAQYVADFYTYHAGWGRRPSIDQTAGRHLTPADALVATLIPDRPPDSDMPSPSKQPTEHTEHHQAGHED